MPDMTPAPRRRPLWRLFIMPALLLVAAAAWSGFWFYAASEVGVRADAWLAQAEEHPGSWWTDWSDWLRPFGGKQVAAPKAPGNRKWKAIEPAPGRYVKEKA